MHRVLADDLVCARVFVKRRKPPPFAVYIAAFTIYIVRREKKKRRNNKKNRVRLSLVLGKQRDGSPSKVKNVARSWDKFDAAKERKEKQIPGRKIARQIEVELDELAEAIFILTKCR